eukprot:6487419-Amphidinium_carterae.1
MSLEDVKTRVCAYARIVLVILRCFALNPALDLRYSCSCNVLDIIRLNLAKGMLGSLCRTHPLTASKCQERNAASMRVTSDTPPHPLQP